jgi:hypothetical protein
LSTVTVEIRLARPGDERLIQTVAAGVFDHDPQTELTMEFLRDPQHHLVVAIADGRVAAADVIDSETATPILAGDYR